MRYILALGVASVLFSSAAAQELSIPSAHYPEIPSSGAQAGAFVPIGWAIEKQVKGDISGDGRDDLVLVIKEQDPAKRLRNTGLGNDLVDTNPRMLLIALGSDNGFRLAKKNHSLIPRYEEPTFSDPFGEEGAIEYRHGAVTVTLGLFANAGGSDAGPSRFAMRWQGDDLRLIGFDRFNVQRNTGATSELSINYLSGRIKEAYGRADRNEPDTVRWHRLRRHSPPSIDVIDDWIGFDPEGWSTRVFG
jgi:hypothetical protein